MSMSIRQMLYAISLVLVTAGLSLGADLYLTYQSFSAMAKSGPAKRRETPVSVSSKVEKVDYRVIEKRNLFSSTPLGRTKKKAVRPQPASRKAAARPIPKLPGKPVPASLNLKLVGTTVGPEGMRFAIFKEKGSGAQKIHRLGESINGAVIKEVKRGEVTLEYNGKSQIFRAFEEKKVDTRSPRRSSGRRGLEPHSRLRSSSGVDPRLGIPHIPGAPPSEVSPLGRGARVEPSKRTRILSRTRLERLLKSAGDLDSQFRTAPFRSPDGDTGVRVFPAGRGRFLRLLGIRGGDVVFDVNGSGINNKGDLSSAFRSIMQQDAAQIAVLRQGKKMNIAYRIR